MIGKPAPGDEILVTLYLDKSSRLCASMRGIYDLLSTDSPYRAGNEVTGRIYEFSKNFGTFLAVDDFYSARIPVHENTKHLKIGQTIRARVTARKPDGKLDLSIREKAYLQTDKDVLEFYRTMSGGPVKKEADEKRSRGRPKKFHGASTVMRVPNELSEPLKRILEDWSENEKRNELELVLIPHKYMDDVEDILNRKK